MGMIRYSYGRGFWDEWWVKDDSDEEWWLSVDEGDMVLEKLIENEDDISLFKDAYIGEKSGKEWIVTEIGEGSCEGFAGSLPHRIIIGQTHRYIHLSGYKATLKTLEVDTTGMRTYRGKWINPFDIKDGYS